MKIDRKTYRATAFNERLRFLILHYTAGNFKSSAKTLTGPDVSAHYLISDEGSVKSTPLIKIYQLVDEKKRAWHAGVSHWQGRDNLNDTSIGIEIVNSGFVKDKSKITWFSYPAVQVQEIIHLCKDIIKRYKIDPTCVIGHSDVAPGRKQDPGPLFPWEELYQKGIGAWPNKEVVADKMNSVDLENIKNIQKDLQSYGYKINLTGQIDQQTTDVIQAFQMHFRPKDFSGKIDRETIAVLHALIQKYKNISPASVLSEPASSPVISLAEINTASPILSLFDKEIFVTHMKRHLFGDSMSGSQQEGCTQIIHSFQRAYPSGDVRCLAYMLATTYHETAQAMLPIEEHSRGQGRTYGEIDKETQKAYYGRGYVQLTLKENYEKMGMILGIDLVNYPEKALEIPVATNILFQGMISGCFTGKKIADYIPESTSAVHDFVSARQIIHRTDSTEYHSLAKTIAHYAETFLSGIKRACGQEVSISTPEERIHIVQPGETLFAIARKYYGKANSELMNKIVQNNRDILLNANQIRPGQALKMPLLSTKISSLSSFIPTYL